MEKVTLLSVLVGAVVIPLLASRDPQPVRGFKRMVVGLFAFNLFYAFALRFIYPRLLG